MATGQFRLLAMAFAICVLGLTGCSGHASSEATASTQAMPLSPITDKLVACFAKHGWKVKRSVQSGVDSVGNIPESQQSRWNSVSTECGKTTGFNKVGQRSGLTDTQLHELYLQEVAEHSCLAKLGIVSAEPASEQKYIETYGTKNQYYAMEPGFDSLSNGEMADVTLRCPPPTWFMNLKGLG